MRITLAKDIAELIQSRAHFPFKVEKDISINLRGRSDKYLAYKRKTKIWESGDLFLNMVSF